jgi:protein dithiol:quinone oxidoreductase
MRYCLINGYHNTDAIMKLNPFAWSFRAQFFFGFLVCAALLAYALYADKLLGFDPCPLCIFQRIAFIGLGVVGLLGALHNPKSKLGRAIYGVLAIIAGGVGIYLASRHVYLQHLPKDLVPACGSGLSYLLEAIPSKLEVIAMVLKGSGECAEVNWQWLGFSMPEWTLLCFILLTLGSIVAAFKKR